MLIFFQMASFNSFPVNLDINNNHMLIQKNNNYKVKADNEDWRDYIYMSSQNPLKERVDLRPWCSRVEDQGHLGSCTGQSVAGAYELLLNKEQPEKFVDLSRLYVYYNARLIEGDTSEDEGAYLRDAVKAVHQYGVCSESIWPYNINHFAMRPTVESYEDGKNRNIRNYYRLLNVNDTVDALTNDLPVMFSFRVYSAFDNLEFTKNYILDMPGKTEQPIGGHAMVFVGYDLEKRLFLARNSFGADWCMRGYCWIPFQYVTDEVMDSWVFDIDLK